MTPILYKACIYCTIFHSFPILLWSKVPQDEQQVVKPMSRNPILQFCELVARQQLSFVDTRYKEVEKNAHKTGKKNDGMMSWRHQTKRGPACLCSVLCGDRFEGSHHMCT